MSEERCRLRPIDDQIVIQPTAEAMSKLIVMPDTVKMQPTRGTVLRVGPGRLLVSGTHHPSQVKEGDEILFRMYSGAGVTNGKYDVQIIRENDVLAVIEVEIPVELPEANP